MNQSIIKTEKFGNGFLIESYTEKGDIKISYCDENKMPMPFAENVERIAVFSNGYYIVKIKGVVVSKTNVEILNGNDSSETFLFPDVYSDCYIYCDDKGNKIHSFPNGDEYCFFEYQNEIYIIQKSEDGDSFCLADQNAKLVKELDDVFFAQNGDIALLSEKDCFWMKQKDLKIYMVTSIFETRNHMFQQHPMFRMHWKEEHLENGDVLFHSPISLEKMDEMFGKKWSDSQKKHWNRLFKAFPEERPFDERPVLFKKVNVHKQFEVVQAEIINDLNGKEK